MQQPALEATDRVDMDEMAARRWEPLDFIKFSTQMNVLTAFQAIFSTKTFNDAELQSHSKVFKV